MVDHYVEEAQRYHSLAMRQRLEIAYTREENQRLKVRVGVLGDQLSSALEGAMESWDDVERVQQEACGFALGAGMEVGALEHMLDSIAAVPAVADSFDPSAEECVVDGVEGAVETLEAECDAALARVERLEVELFEARAERDGLRAALQGHLDLAYRAERLEKALENIQLCRCIRDGNKFHECNCSCASVRRHAAAALREGKP